MAIPGLYIPIRGDYSDFQKDMNRLAGIARQQGEDIANALNQAISPQDAVKGLKAIGSALKQLTAAAQSTGKTLNAPIQELDEFAARANVARGVVEELHHAMVRTARDRQIESNLRTLQRQCGLTASAMARLRAEMGDVAGSVNNAMQGLGIRPLRAIQDEIREVEAQYQHMLEMFRSGHATENDVARAFAARGQRMEALQREAGTWQDPARASALRQRYDTLVAQAGRGRTSFSQFEARDTARNAVNAFQELHGRLPRASEIRQIAQACGASAAQIRRMRDELDHSSNAFKALIGYAQVWLTFGFVHTAQDFVKTAMALENVEVAFKAIYGTTDMAQKKLEFVRQVSDELGLSFLDTAEGAKKLFAAAQGTPIEAEANMVFKAFSNMSAAMKLTGDETKGVFLAVSQMISKGKVSAEELRQQLAERMPGAVNLFASSIGVSTQELDAMLQKGAVTLEHFLTFARAVNERYAAGATQASHTLQAELARIGNTWANFQKDMTDTGKLAGWARSFNDVFKGATSAIAKFSDEIGTLMHMALAAWIASSLTPGGKLNTVFSSLALTLRTARTSMDGFTASTTAAATRMGMLGKAAKALMSNPLIAGLLTAGTVFGVEKLLESTEDKNAFEQGGDSMRDIIRARARSAAADKQSQFTPEETRNLLLEDTKKQFARFDLGMDSLGLDVTKELSKKRSIAEDSLFSSEKDIENVAKLSEAYNYATSRLREMQQASQQAFDAKQPEGFLKVQKDIAVTWDKVEEKLRAAGATDEMVSKFDAAFKAMDETAGVGFDNISKHLATFAADSVSAAKTLGLEMDKATSKMFDKMEKASQSSAIGKAAKDVENFQKVAKMLGDVPLAQSFDASIAACGQFSDEITGLIGKVGNAEKVAHQYWSQLIQTSEGYRQGTIAGDEFTKAQEQVDAQTKELTEWQDRLALAIFQTASAAGGTDAQFNVMTQALKAAEQAGIITAEMLDKVLQKVNEVRGAAAAAMAEAADAAVYAAADNAFLDANLQKNFKGKNRELWITNYQLRHPNKDGSVLSRDAVGTLYDRKRDAQNILDSLKDPKKGGKRGGGGSKRVDNTAEKYDSAYEGFRKEIAKLQGEVDLVTLDKKFADMDKQLVGSKHNIQQLKKEYYEAFNVHSLHEFEKTMYQLVGNEKALADIDIEEKLKAQQAQFDGMNKAAQELGLATVDYTAKMEAFRKALQNNSNEQWLEKQIPVYQEIAIYEKDKTKVLELQNQLIDIQAEKMANTFPPEVVERWKEVQRLQNATDAWSGVRRGFNSIAKDSMNAAQFMENTMTQTYDILSEGFTNFVNNGKVDMQDLLNSWINMVNQMVMKAAMSKVFDLIGGLFSSGAGALSGAAGGIQMGSTTSSIGSSISAGAMAVSALGNVFTGLHGWANQIVTRPTLFSYGSQITKFAKGGIMGEAGPEAIMPLTRTASGHLGVRTDGGASPQSMAVTLVISDQTEGGVKADATGGELDGKQIAVIVKQVENAMVARSLNGKSQYTKYLDRTRGLSNAKQLY